ncbi:MAG: LysM peptidoglycan-binding domain-containing protein [Betaproteobacteria bacterium]|nr:LysM peptidoglycan-binding domain-containing protein [Betaproteobacteria bacterium]
MNINTTTLDRLAGPQASDAPRVGDGSFQAVYERAVGGNRAPVAREDVAVYQAASTVRAGDTLHGIVRARLAKMGVEVNAKTAMQVVKQVAQANNIRNPDRIYVGQKLDLAGLASTFGPGQTAPLARGIDSPVAADSGFEPLRHLRWEEPAPEADAQVATDEVDLPSPVAGMPPDDPAAEVYASRQVAIYEQNASLAPEKPAEPASALPDILYKGVVGKVLDALPLEPATRTTLQKANTVVSGTLTVRSLGALAGFGGPLLTVAGLIWGIFSSRQIDPAAAGVKATGETKTADAPKPAGNAVRVAENKPSEPLN